MCARIQHSRREKQGKKHRFKLDFFFYYWDIMIVPLHGRSQAHHLSKELFWSVKPIHVVEIMCGRELACGVHSSQQPWGLHYSHSTFLARYLSHNFEFHLRLIIERKLTTSVILVNGGAVALYMTQSISLIVNTTGTFSISLSSREPLSLAPTSL